MRAPIAKPIALYAAVIALLFGGLCLAASTAAAQERVALVIGNGGYRHVPALPNPGNDASDIAVALTRLGFSVTRIADAGYEAMRRSLLDFGRTARAAEMAVVYFAGHGIEVGGENFLIPVDAELRSDVDAEHEAIGLRSVMLSVQGARRLGLVILDACRNSPFGARMQLTVRTRSVTRGLARIEPTGGVLVAYAAREGTTADDGKGRNSPFTAALLRHVETPGQEVNFLFRRVRDEVLKATDGRQEPYTYGALGGDPIYLKAAPSAVQPPAPSAASTSGAALAWDAVKDTDDPAVLEAFLKEFPVGVYAALARARLKVLTEKKMAVGVAEQAPQLRVAERAVLYEEDPANALGNRFIGAVIWRTETVASGPGLSAERSVRADVEFPERRLALTMSIRRNLDAALPASHTVEFNFTLPPDAPFGGVSDVPGLLMKEAEQGRGAPLSGLGVKVADGFFLVGLSAGEADRQRNMELLRGRAWFDVPMVYKNGRRAIIAIEKGSSGESAFAQAFASWGTIVLPTKPVPTKPQIGPAASGWSHVPLPGAPGVSSTPTPAASPSIAGGYVVQVASQRTMQESQSAFKTLQEKYPDVLAGRPVVFRPVDLGDRGTFYRVQVGPFATVEQANDICGSLRTAGGQCIVQRN